MPTLRSSSYQNKSTESMKSSQKETSQWVMMGPDHVLSDEEEKSFHKLPHPHNGVPSLFLFHRNKVYELMKFKEDYRSWFIDESVQKDGAFHIITLVDPLFLVLPYFEKAAERGQYTTLDNIMCDECNNAGVKKLESCISKEILSSLCACKGDEDYTAYKLCEDRVLSWLTKKIQKLSSHLQNSNINICSGAQVSSFVKSSAGNKSEDDCLRYAWMTVSDYITSKWSEQLKKKLNIKDAVKVIVKEDEDTPPAKKQKLNNNNDECLEDYRDHSVKKETKKVAPKMTSQQKSLLKVDKKGMKSMKSFFQSKGKK